MKKMLFIVAGLLLATPAVAQTSAPSPTLNLLRLKQPPIVEGCSGPLRGNGTSNATCGAIGPADVTGLGSVVVADTTGATSASAAINALTTAGKTAVLPCGTYLITTSIRMANGASLDGQGCATLKASASLAVNSDFLTVPGASGTMKNLVANASVSGNSNIVVKNVILDGTLAPSSTYLTYFYKASGVQFNGNRCVGPGTANVQDCVAFVQSANYTVRENRCSGVAGVCYDQWDGSHDFEITDNQADGTGTGLSYGIRVNGISTANTANTTYNGVVKGNIIRTTTQTGIWIGGFYNSGNTTYGAVTDVVATGNVVDTSALYGIWVSDGRRNSITGNIVKNIASHGIRVGSQLSGTTDRTTVANNIVVNANTASAGAHAIVVATGASNTILTGNQVEGTMQGYSVALGTGTTNSTLICGRMAAGVSGTYLNSGTGSTVQCHDGTDLALISPGALQFGSAGISGQLTLDADGHLSPSAPGRNFGTSVNYWQSVYVRYISTNPATISTLIVCGVGRHGWAANVSNGQTIAAAAAGTAVGSTTGSTYRNVFCDNGLGWVYN